MLTKQGKEEAEAFFYTLLKACPEPMDMKPVSAAYNSTTWLLGYKPQHVFDFAIAPNAASFFKLTFEGATDMWLVNVASLVKALTAAKVADAESLTKCGYKGVAHRLETMTQEDYDSWSSHGLEIFYFHAKKKSLVYVPCGWFITERVGAAQLNYLAQDRLDLSYASKEVARHMARPMCGAEHGLRRAVRYLMRYPRWVVTYLWQEAPGGFQVFTDSDWGGCTRTRRSTSGGALMHGGHLVTHWSRTQQLVALSSAEAELNASVKAGQEGLALRNLTVELGEECFLELLGDSSANDGVIKRAGAGKIKHLSVRQLWLQEQAGNGELSHRKKPRLENASDCLTHHFTRAEADLHFPRLGCHRPGPLH